MSPEPQSPPEDQPTAGPVLAMIALSDAFRLDADLVAGHLQAAGLPVLAPPESGETGEALLLDYEGGQLGFASMPAPIPWEELEGPCATARWWPEAADALRSHTHHLVVFLIDHDADALVKHVRVSKSIAALLPHLPALGVYWGAGTLVHEPSAFADEARTLDESESKPHLWVDMRIEQAAPNCFRFFTTGLNAFGYREIEVAEAAWTPEDLVQFLYAVVAYVIDTGVVLENGATLGRTSQEQISVTIGPSMFQDREEHVVWVQI